MMAVSREQPMTRFGRVNKDVTGEMLLEFGCVTEGEWNKLRAWFCCYCQMSRPFRKDGVDEILHHFATEHAEELRNAGLTEPPEPVMVRSSLVDEHGNALFFER